MSVSGTYRGAAVQELDGYGVTIRRVQGARDSSVIGLATEYRIQRIYDDSA